MSQKPAWLAPRGRPWIRGAERLIFENPWIRVLGYDATAPTGNPAAYGLVSFKNLAVAVLPVHADGTITLVGQARLPHDDYSWELPEGGAPMDEDPLAGAKRELAEEVGLVAGDWRQILNTQLSNSVTDERMIGYLALDLQPAKERHAPDDTEDLAIARVPFREALEAAMAGHMPDMLTVAMLLRGYHMAKEGSLPGALTLAMLG